MLRQSWVNWKRNDGPQNSVPARLGRARFIGSFRFMSLLMITVAMILIPVTICPGNSTGNPGWFNGTRLPTATPCKYSVRDVAFVNVHGKAWQLQLIKPSDSGPAQLEDWSKTVRTKLDRSNVGYLWLDPDSQEAQRLTNRFGTKLTGRPAMALTGPGEIVIPVSADESDSRSFAERIDHVLQSPARQEILKQVVDTLCVFVLVESADKDKNLDAKTNCEKAIKKINAQMWTLEKPTDNGPALVTISNQHRPAERWLLQSLGIEDQTTPAVAVVYGQGRRLGEVLTGEDLAVEKIVGRASVCGRDCECSLDRDWLYGRQMIHVWDQRLERAAEQSLTFDPNSAFVIAEVAQIIRKNSLAPTPDQRVDLGAGLIVHDLDSIPDSQPAEDNEISTEAINQSMGQSPTPRTNDLDVTPTIQPVSSKFFAIPWKLMVGLLGILAAAFVWFQWKASSR